MESHLKDMLEVYAQYLEVIVRPMVLLPHYCERRVTPEQLVWLMIFEYLKLQIQN